MDELKKFIAQMREKKLSDELIYKNLLQKGWDEKIVNEAFLPDDASVPIPGQDKPQEPVNQTIPAKSPEVVSESVANNEQAEIKSEPESAEPTFESPSSNEATDSAAAQKQVKPQISKAESVLHHVFLWIFSITYVINIQTIVSVINGDGNYDQTVLKTLATSVMALVITGVIYAVFYSKFTRKFKRNPELRFHSGWNLATIILGSIAGIATTIGLAGALIWEVPLEETLPRLLPVIIYCGLVILNYSRINFGKVESKFRKRYVLAIYWLAVMITIFAAVGTVGYLYFDKKDDQELKADIVSIAKENYRYYVLGDKVAKQLSDLEIESSKANYRVTNESRTEVKNDCSVIVENCQEITVKYPSFEVCGDFKYSTEKEYNYRKSKHKEIIVLEDEYFSSYELEPIKKGKNCFLFEIHE